MPSIPPVVEMIEGETLRYYVRSRSGDVRRLVDLGEWDGNGQCNCQQFTYRIAPMLKRGDTPGPATECWHIQQAKRYFNRLMIEALKAKNGEAEPTPPANANCCIHGVDFSTICNQCYDERTNESQSANPF